MAHGLVNSYMWYTFTVLDEGALAHSHEGNHVLTIIKESESYESQHTTSDIRSEVQSLSSIEVEGEKYTHILPWWGLEVFGFGDWNRLCQKHIRRIWCKCSMDESGDLKKEWSITDV